MRIETFSDRSDVLEAIIVTPKKKEGKLPLVLFPHGGPHGSFTTDYSAMVLGFVKSGYAVAMGIYFDSVYFLKFGSELYGVTWVRAGRD